MNYECTIINDDIIDYDDFVGMVEQFIAMHKGWADMIRPRSLRATQKVFYKWTSVPHGGLK